MSNPSIKKNFAYSTIYQILSIIAPFITAPYLSRVLGPEKLGIQSYVESVQYYFLLVAALGTQSYGSREIARNRDNIEIRSKLFWEIELMTVFTSLIAIIAWLCLIAVSSENRIYYVVIIPYLFASMFDITWYFKGLEKFKLTVTRNIVCQILIIVLMFILVKSEDDLIIYMILLSMTKLLSSLSLWTYIPKHTTKVSFKEIKLIPHLKQSMLYFIPTVATSVYLVLDKTLIGVITRDNAQNGFYEQADKVMKIAKTISFTSINAVVGVRISYLFAENKIKEIHQRIENSMNYILFMGIGCACGISAIARNFVPLFFGEGYADVVYLLYILCPIVVIIGISNCLGTQYYTPSGRRAQSSKYLIAGSCVNLIMNLIMIPFLGAYGAATASIFAELTITILYIKNSDNYITLRFLFEAGWKKIIAGVIMTIVVYYIGKSVIINDIFTIIMQVICGVVIYLSFLLILRDAWINSYMKEIKGKYISKLKKN